MNFSSEHPFTRWHGPRFTARVFPALAALRFRYTPIALGDSNVGRPARTFSFTGPVDDETLHLFVVFVMGLPLLSGARNELGPVTRVRSGSGRGEDDRSSIRSR